MKTEELMLGNIVNNNGIANIISSIGIVDVILVTKKGTVYSLIDSIKPIPITEEWLLHLQGIDKGYAIEINAKRKKIVFTWSSKIISTGKRNGWHCNKYKNIKYVHQLQNLYFTLTGEELLKQ